jgi:glutaredoxin 3
MKPELYYFEKCPFCQKVLLFISETEHNIILKDIRQDKTFKDELIKIVGKNQVPCLIVDGYPMLESDDIIKYLDTNRDKWNNAGIY